MTQTEALNLALEALDQLTNVADTFSVSGVYLNEEVWAKKCLSDAYFAIATIEEALAQQEGQSNYCLQCEALSRELTALKTQQSNEQSKCNHTKTITRADIDGNQIETTCGECGERVAQQSNEQVEPVGMYRNKCADGSRCLHGCHTNEPCYTHPPVPTAQPKEPLVINSQEKASEFIEKTLWEVIDVAAMFPKAKPDPRTWEHLMVYSPQPKEPEQEPVATFDEVWDSIDWDKWRMEPIRELCRMIISKTTPPQRKPLTYVDLRRISNQCGLGANKVSARTQATVDNFARAIEAAHGIKE